jgi:SAM-dependent methyltransferase
MQDNKIQANYWSSTPGLKWIKFEEELDVVFDQVNQELIRRANPQSGEHVLDIGCGTGATSRAFSQHLAPDGSVTALDISEPLLKHAESRSAGSAVDSRYCFLDAQQDVIPGAPFDIVTSRFGIMFFSDPVSAFVNIRRHLTKNGRLIVAAWAPMKGNPWFEVPRNAAVAQLGPPDPSYPNAPGPLGFQNLEYVVDILKQAGFQDVVGETAEVTLRYPGPLREVAALASNIGPAARILKKYAGSNADIEAIRRTVMEEFRVFKSPTCIEIPAQLNFFVSSNIA